MLLRVACICILCGILVAGLWPFHAPRSNVHWLDHGGGLEIAKYGSIVTSGEFVNRGPEGDDSCTLEIWLAPKRTNASGTILAFYRPETHQSPFALRQSLSDLTIESLFKGQPQSGGKRKVYVDDLFSHPRLVLVTITSSSTGTLIYADGALAKTLPKFRFLTKDLTGRLILGNSPFSTDEWSGVLKGVAIYSRSMLLEEIIGHYKQWTSGDTPKPADDVIALYRFDEGSGDLVHNQIQATTSLTIPSRFFILDEQFLERPWKEFRNDGHYWEDVAVNIAGFIPLGLVFFAYLSVAGKFKNAALLTLALGFAASLTIEVGQAFLPTRNSGMTDIITNTLGTAFGILLFRIDFLRILFVTAGMLPSTTTTSNEDEDLAYEMVPAAASDSSK